MAATLRFVSGAAALPGLRLSLISQDPLEKLPADLRARLAGHWRVDDCFNPAQLVAAARGLAQQLGPLERMIGSLEQLQVPLAEACAALSLPGLTVAAAINFRDKNRMKDVFESAGVPCARHRSVATAAAATEFASAVGFPIVVKPLAGAGAKNTFRLNAPAELEQYLSSYPPSSVSPVLFEEFLSGEEFSFDSVMLNGQMLWHSISSYRPSPLTVVENPWIQWCVLLPRDIDGPQFSGIRGIAERAVSALGLRTGMTHMEWFRRADGAIAISEVAARPPGAQFTTLISYAHDMDFYRAWPRLLVFDQFDVPSRKYATGAAYLRGLGAGRVAAIDGLDVIHREFGDIIVEANWPRPGVTQSTGYEGIGHVIYRHADTERVERALRRTVEVVRVRLV